MTRVDRARLTIVDVVYLLASLAILAGLYPIYNQFLEQNAYLMSTGYVWLARLLLPLIMLTLLSSIYVNAVQGWS